MTTEPKITVRREDMSEQEKLAHRLRREIKQQEKAFKQAQKLNRPRLNKERVLQKFGQEADETAQALSELTLKVMSLQTAFSYAQSMIEQDVEGEGVEWQTDGAFRIAERIQVIESTRIMLNHFKIGKRLANSIIANTIAKQFGIAPASLAAPQNNTNGVPTVTGNQVKQILDEYNKNIKTERA